MKYAIPLCTMLMLAFIAPHLVKAQTFPTPVAVQQEAASVVNPCAYQAAGDACGCSVNCCDCAPCCCCCSQFYVEAFGGWPFHDSQEYNGVPFPMMDQFNLGASVGTALTANIDIEFEYFHTEATYSGFGTELIADCLMMNGIYDLQMGQLLGDCGAAQFTPYVGAGLGAIQVTYDGKGAFPASSGHNWELGYQVVGGVRFPLVGCLEGFAEYRWIAVTENVNIQFGNVGYDSSNLSIGVRKNFWRKPVSS